MRRPARFAVPLATNSFAALHGTAQDRTIVATVADGRQVQDKLIVVPEIHVGPFSAENIECLISPPSAVPPPDLLGGAFQCHFLCRLDQQAGVLHLTPIDKQASLGAPGAAPGAVPTRVAEAPPNEPGPDAAYAAFAAVLGDADAGRDNPAVRAAVPDAAARKAAQKLILELMPKEFADTTLKGKRALGAALLARGQTTNDDPAGCYELLWEACAAAAESGDLSTVMKAVSELGRRYQIDTLAWKVTELTRLAPRLTSPVDQAQVAAHGLLAVQAMVRAESYADVGKMSAIIRNAAGASHSQQVQTQVHHQLARLEAAEAQYALAKPAMDKLKASPDDPAANLAVGRFECFARGDFDKGLPLLAKGTDPALKAAAAADLAKPTTGEACEAAGDAWWDQAMKEAGDADAAEQCKARAGLWYRQAVGQLNGLAKILVQKRLDSLEEPIRPASVPAASVPAASANEPHPGKTVDLLKLHVLSKDIVAGTWGLNRALKPPKLMVLHGEFCRIQFPYQPPEEYDFEATFTYTTNGGPIILMCPLSNGAIMWYTEFNKSAFESRGQRVVEGQGPFITRGEQYTSLVKVRKDKVQGFLNGRLVCEFDRARHDPPALSANWLLRDSGVVGLGVWNSDATFTKAEVTEISGPGQVVAR